MLEYWESSAEGLFWLLIACQMLLLPVLLHACYTDVTSRRVSNRDNRLVAILGAIAWFTGTVSWSLAAMQLAIFLAFLIPLLALFRLGTLGGGDVKLLLAASIWLSPEQALIFVGLVAVFGMFVAIATMVFRRSFGTLLFRRIMGRSEEVPYAVAIALALVHVLVLTHPLAWWWVR